MYISRLIIYSLCCAASVLRPLPFNRCLRVLSALCEIVHCCAGKSIDRARAHVAGISRQYKEVVPSVNARATRVLLLLLLLCLILLSAHLTNAVYIYI